MYKYFWYSDEILNKLNKLGYVHFSLKESVDSIDMGEVPFMCHTEKKIYGLIDVIPLLEIDKIEDNLRWLNDELENGKN